MPGIIELALGLEQPKLGTSWHKKKLAPAHENVGSFLLFGSCGGDDFRDVGAPSEKDVIPPQIDCRGYRVQSLLAERMPNTHCVASKSRKAFEGGQLSRSCLVSGTPPVTTL